MAAWIDDELWRLGDAEELEIAAVHRDGTRRDAAPIMSRAMRKANEADLRRLKALLER